MTDPTKACKKGEILYGTNNKNKRGIPTHYIIYLSPYADDKNLFLGAMLTHSKGYGNISLENDHFIQKDENGNEYEVSYDNSLIVKKCFLKKMEWAPFTKVGNLSVKGIQFIDSTIGTLSPEFFPFNAD